MPAYTAKELLRGLGGGDTNPIYYAAWAAIRKKEAGNDWRQQQFN